MPFAFEVHAIYINHVTVLLQFWEKVTSISLSVLCVFFHIAWDGPRIMVQLSKYIDHCGSDHCVWSVISAIDVTFVLFMCHKALIKVTNLSFMDLGLHFNCVELQCMGIFEYFIICLFAFIFQLSEHSFICTVLSSCRGKLATGKPFCGPCLYSQHHHR